MDYRLIDRLLDQGHEMIFVENIFAAPKCNINQLRQHPRFKFTRPDVISLLRLKFEKIYNFAPNDHQKYIP